MKFNHFLLLVLITGLAGHAPATQQPSAATMTTQNFEFVSNGIGSSALSMFQRAAPREP